MDGLQTCPAEKSACKEIFCQFASGQIFSILIDIVWSVGYYDDDLG